MKPRFVFRACVVSILSVSPVIAGEVSPGRDDAWQPTRTESRSDFFPDDVPAVQSSATDELIEPVAPHPIVQRLSAQPGHVPPAPEPGNGPPVGPYEPANPLTSTDSGTPPPSNGTVAGPNGFSDAVEQPAGGCGCSTGGCPQVCNVDQVINGECGEYGCSADTGCRKSRNNWCKKHWWKVCRSTCDMPQHLPYYPACHGYYYFLPYNYCHVLQHKQLAPLLGAEPIAPYETRELFDRIYVQVLGDEAFEPGTEGTLEPITPDDEVLPDLQDLLESKHDKDGPDDGPPKPAPPKPKAQGK